MRILITGATGQVGLELVRTCLDAGDDVIGLSSRDLDLADRVAVREAVAAHRPDAVVNTAAWTAVDDCESDPERAMRVNGIALRWLAAAAVEVGAHLVQVSTDYVFDGTKPEPYDEWDATCPVSAYGRSKCVGEEEARAAGTGATVVRTAWVQSAHRRNVVKTVLSLRDRPELAFVDDQRGSPTFADELAPLLRTLAAERIGGTFHATNRGAVTWYGFAREILATAGADPDVVRPITTAELDPPRPAARPANSVLDNAALRMSGLPLLSDYREPLGRVVQALLT